MIELHARFAYIVHAVHKNREHRIERREVRRGKWGKVLQQQSQTNLKKRVIEFPSGRELNSREESTVFGDMTMSSKKVSFHETQRAVVDSRALQPPRWICAQSDSYSKMKTALSPTTALTSTYRFAHAWVNLPHRSRFQSLRWQTETKNCLPQLIT